MAIPDARIDGAWSDNVIGDDKRDWQ